MIARSVTYAQRMEKALSLAGIRSQIFRAPKELTSMILQRGTAPRTAALKAVTEVLDAAPVLDARGLSLALWLRQRYFCTLYEAVKTILPAGLWYQLREVYRVAEGLDESATREATGKASPVWDVLFAGGGSADLETLKASCGEAVSETLRSLCKKGVLTCETAALRRLGDRMRRMVELAVDAEEAMWSYTASAAEPK